MSCPAWQNSNWVSFALLQVTGPTLRAFGLCLTISGTVVCELLSAAMDMVLIPHHAQRFAELVSLFRELPQMVNGLPLPLVLLNALCTGLITAHALIVVSGTGLFLLLKNYLVACCQPASCRTLLALSTARALQMADLHEHYHTCKQAAVEPRFLDCNGVQLPNPLWDAAQWPEAYQMFPGRLVFQATKQDAAGVQQVVVKFTQRYGTATHLAWAKAGLVPPLVGEPVSLTDDWVQIQTELLSPVIEAKVSGWLPMNCLLHPPAAFTEHQKCLLPGPEERTKLAPQARELLVKAHRVLVDDQPAAHGDARPDNILVLMHSGRIKDLKLIDLDWAGIAGKEKYPILLNTRAIQWPDGVEPGRTLQQKHDLELLDLQVNPATASGFASWRGHHINFPPSSSQLSSVSEDMDIQ